MPTQFNLTTAAFDLLDFLQFMGAHPSVDAKVLGDQFFATCYSARNWKPFIIGILAPDNPIDFIPVKRLAQEVKKAEMPPKIPPKKSSLKKGSDSTDASKGGVIVPMQNKTVTTDEQREALRAAWTRKNGGVPPSEQLLALMCAQMWTESGGVHRDANGQMQVKGSFSPPNYNSFGYHDVGVKPPTFAATYVADGNYWQDDKGHRWSAQGAILPSEPGFSAEAPPIAIMRGKQLYFAPQSGTSSLPQVNPGAKSGDGQKFYDAINRPGMRFLGTDTEGGQPYISSYKAFNTFDDAANEFVGYLYDTFPDVRKAQTPQDYENAIMNGVKMGDVTRKFHDPAANVRADYVKGLTNGLQAYNNRYGSEGDSLSGGGGGRSTDSTDDPSQKIMAYGASFQLDDPLAPVFGRNIAADETRLALIQAQMDRLSQRLADMRRIPPLILLVNPQEFRRSHENMVDSGVKTRVGNIVHTYLEQPIKINASGVSAAQYAVYADMSGGLTNFNRIHSISYRNLMSMVWMYKNNGSLYDAMSGTTNIEGDSVGSTAGDGSIILPGSIFIYYDDHVYIGSFDSLSLTDAADKPHNMAYSFTFTVRYDIHVDMGVDAQLSTALRG